MAVYIFSLTATTGIPHQVRRLLTIPLLSADKKHNTLAQLEVNQGNEEKHFSVVLTADEQISVQFQV